MKDLKLLEEVVIDQYKGFSKRDEGTARNIDFDKYLKTKEIVAVIGIRRSGKSTLLKQFSLKLKDFYYINFEDERILDFSVEDFNDLLLIWRKNWNSKNILMDEIQNIDKWEAFVRRISEEGYKVFITGSSAKLLSSELATKLTGRYYMIEVFPFSFQEFLFFKGMSDFAKLDSESKALIFKYFDEYLFTGGFPEYVTYKDSEFIKRTYGDIIYKDILVRFGIKETKNFRLLTGLLFTNFTKNLSYNSIAQTLKIKSVNSVINYIGFLEDSYLLFELLKYDFSQKKQFTSDKKIYVIDNGMRNNIAFYFSADRGRLLENMIFIELKRRGNELYYFKKDGECDFIVREKERITEAIQVCDNLNQKNEKRELNGLLMAMKEFKIKKGLIITENQEDHRNIDGLEVDIIPAWKWLLRL